MLSQKAIKKFQEIYFNEYKIHLTQDEAEKNGIQLLNLYRSITSGSDHPTHENT